MSFRCAPIFRIEQFAGDLPQFTWPSFPRLFSGTSSPGTSFRFLLWFCCRTSLLNVRPNLTFYHALMSPDQCLYAVCTLIHFTVFTKRDKLAPVPILTEEISLTGIDQFCGTLRKWPCCVPVQKNWSNSCPTLTAYACVKGNRHLMSSGYIIVTFPLIPILIWE